MTIEEAITHVSPYINPGGLTNTAPSITPSSCPATHRHPSADPISARIRNAIGMRDSVWPELA